MNKEKKRVCYERVRETGYSQKHRENSLFFQCILPEAIEQPLANSFYGKTICQKRLQIYTLYRFSSMAKSVEEKNNARATDKKCGKSEM